MGSMKGLCLILNGYIMKETLILIFVMFDLKQTVNYKNNFCDLVLIKVQCHDTVVVYHIIFVGIYII